MNLWRCTVRRAGAGVRLDCGAFAVGPVGAVARPDGSELWLGVRPHDISLAAHAEGDARGVVDVIEPLGPITLVHLRVEGLPDLVRLAVPPDADLRAGATTSFRIRPERVHVFDLRSERRVDVG